MQNNNGNNTDGRMDGRDRRRSGNAGKRRLSAVHIIQRVSQVLFFLFFPGLFATAFYGLKSIVLAATGRTALDTASMGGVIILIGALILTALFGRFFCGFVCSFGAMEDLLAFIAKKLKISRRSFNGAADRILKYLKYAVLVFIVFIVWMLQLVKIPSDASPWTVFGVYSTLGGWTSLSSLLTIGGLLLAVIIVLSLFIERFFCRYLCPLGAIFSLVSRFRIFRIRKNRSRCGSCRFCTRNCTMGIHLEDYDEVTSGECINCFACVDTCMKNNAHADPTPIVVTAVSVAAMGGLVCAGNIVSGNIGTSASTAVSTQTTKGKYTDGTYTGTGKGFRGDTKVSVEVSNGNITDITVVSHEDDDEYFNRAKNTIISEILESQDTDVATVSGATFSSNGLIDAVKDALSETSGSTSDSSTASTGTESSGQSSAGTGSQNDSAAQDSTAQQDQTQDSAAQGSTDTSASSSQSAATGTFQDGTYTGTGTGLRGETEVSVTVSGGQITDITVVSYADDQQFFSRAESTVISEIIQSQSVDVSTVSGATFSSNGIKAAVANALGISFTNPNESASAAQGGPGGR